jgi:hypothetical protein
VCVAVVEESFVVDDEYTTFVVYSDTCVYVDVDVPSASEFVFFEGDTYRVVCCKFGFEKF